MRPERRGVAAAGHQRAPLSPDSGRGRFRREGQGLGAQGRSGVGQLSAQHPSCVPGRGS